MSAVERISFRSTPTCSLRSLTTRQERIWGRRPAVFVRAAGLLPLRPCRL